MKRTFLILGFLLMGLVASTVMVSAAPDTPLRRATIPTPTATLTLTASATTTATPLPPTSTPTATPGVIDVYEPDSRLSPPTLFVSESMLRVFTPTSDVDYALLDIKANRRYRVFTTQLAAGVDTVLSVEVGNAVYTNDDENDTTLSSAVEFVSATDTTALVTVENRGQFGASASYRLQASFSTVPPTPLPTGTPTISPTPTQVGAACADTEPTNNTAPTLIAVNQVRCAYIDRNGDIDLFSVTVKAGRTYQVLVTPRTGFVDPLTTVNVGTIEYQDDDGGGGTASRVIFAVSQNGTARIRVQSNITAGERTDDYLYDIEVTEYFPNVSDTYEPDAAVCPTFDFSTLYQRAHDPVNDVDCAIFGPFATGREYEIVATALVGVAPRIEFTVGGETYTNDDDTDSDPQGRVSRIVFRLDDSAPSGQLRILNRNNSWGEEVQYTVILQPVIRPTPAPQPTTATGATATPQATATATRPAADRYEPDNDVQPPVYRLGEFMERAFDSPDDTDFAILTVKFGSYYRITVSAIGAGVDPDLELFFFEDGKWDLYARNDDVTAGDTTAELNIGPVPVNGAMLIKVRNRTPLPAGTAAEETTYVIEAIMRTPPTPTLTPTRVPPTTGGNTGGSTGGTTPPPLPPTSVPVPPTPPVSVQPTPTDPNAPVTVLVVYFVDENLDGAWQTTEGIGGATVQGRDGVTTVSTRTDSTGLASLTIKRTALISIPATGFTATVPPDGILFVPVAPITVPSVLP